MCRSPQKVAIMHRQWNWANCMKCLLFSQSPHEAKQCRQDAEHVDTQEFYLKMIISITFSSFCCFVKKSLFYFTYNNLHFDFFFFSIYKTFFKITCQSTICQIKLNISAISPISLRGTLWLQPFCTLRSPPDDTLPDLCHVWTWVTEDTRGLENLSGTWLLSPSVGPHAPSPDTWTPICPFPDLTGHYEGRWWERLSEAETLILKSWGAA